MSRNLKDFTQSNKNITLDRAIKIYKTAVRSTLVFAAKTRAVTTRKSHLVNTYRMKT